MKLRHLARVLLYPFKPFRELKRPIFVRDPDLERRRETTAKAMPVNSIKSLRRT